MTDDRSFGKKAASSVAWIAADKWSNRITSLVVLTVLGRLLTPADFGLVALATSFIVFGAVFVEQGFSKSLIQRAEITREETNTAFWTSVVSAVVIGGIFAALAPLFGQLTNNDELAPVVQLLSLGLVINALSSTPAALLEREFKFRSLAIRRLVGTVLGGVTAIAAAFLGFGVWALVAQALVAAIAGLITLWAATSWRPGFQFSWTALRALRSVGLSVMGIEFIGLINSQADRILIGTFLSAEALGYYYFAMRIISIMAELFSSVFSGISLTAFSRLQNDRPKLLSWFYRLTGLSSAVAIPFFAVAAIMSPVLLPLVFGQQWVPSVQIMQVLCFLGALNAVAYFDRSLLLSVGHAKVALLLTLGQSVLGVALEAAAIPFGVLAVAIAVTARQYVYWPVRLWVLRKYVGVNPGRYWAQWLRPFLLSVAVVAGAYGISLIWPDLDLNPIAFIAVNLVWCIIGFGVGTWLLLPNVVDDFKKVLKRKL